MNQIKQNYNEKKKEAKALKPSQMGLHSKVRYEIMFQSKNRMEQVKEIVEFATAFYDFIYDYIEKKHWENMDITQKLARFVSLIFTFVGFEDDEIYHILLKASEIKRKKSRRS